jgi:hypothetical protein
VTAVTTQRLVELAWEACGEAESAGGSAIYHAGTRIGHALVCLRAGTAELFMARQLGYHAVVAYEPASARDGVGDLARRQLVELLAAGLPPSTAEPAVAALMTDLHLERLQASRDHVPAVARLLDMPLLSVWGPVDELARRRLHELVDGVLAAHAGASVHDLREALLADPILAGDEYVPVLALGRWDAPTGQLAISCSALGGGGYAILNAYLNYGVDTVICDSLTPEVAWRLREAETPGNVLVLGRAATATMGLAPYLSRLRAEGLEVTFLGGVRDPAEPSGQGG